ncbi:uncharacterized protein JCM15063_000751 [Sporobolomyces koalae]|uniref:uncharacterized protein n=1 Tax=Sporobolomyces koalae TaxID=500713 RepID=UPI00317FC7D3
MPISNLAIDPTVFANLKRPCSLGSRTASLAFTIRAVYQRQSSRNNPDTIGVVEHEFGEGDSSRWPEQDPDMTLLEPSHEMHKHWRRVAGEVLAKDLGLYRDWATHWTLDELPKGYALFEQVTPRKGEPTQSEGGKRVRHDRFLFGHDGRKMRSAASLGKHMSWLLRDKAGACPCDGCKVYGNSAIELSPAPGGSKSTKRNADGLDDHVEEESVGSGTGPGNDVATAAPTGTGTGRGGRGANKAAKTASTAPVSGVKAVVGQRGKSKRKAKLKEWEEDDDDDFDMDDGGAYDDFDEDDGAYSSDYGPPSTSRKTASGRVSRAPTSRGASVQQQPPPQSTQSPAQQVPAQQQKKKISPLEPPTVDNISKFMTPAPPEIAAQASTLAAEEVQQDLRLPTLPRVGELIWCRVPLARPPGAQRRYIGDADFSRWPGIVRERRIKGKSDELDVRYGVELMAQNPNDALEAVRLENIIPWLQFIPANTETMDAKQWQWESRTLDGKKKGWSNIQQEGWGSVVGAYWRAHRIAKCFASMQLRSIPMIAVGPHLSAPPPKAGQATVAPVERREELVQNPPRTAYLSHSHVFHGPELLHVGDFVRLNPDAVLDPKIQRTQTDPDRKLLPLSLILHVSEIYRGGAGSPLVARGAIYEMVELPSSEDNRRVDPRLFEEELSISMLKTLPRPFPQHKWRCLTSKGSEGGGETDVLWNDVAGRYYAFSGKVCDKPELVNHALMRARDATYQTAQQKYQYDQAVKLARAKAEETGKPAVPPPGAPPAWAISTGGKGLNGVEAMRLLLAGLTGTSATARIDAKFGVSGDRANQLRIAEEMAEAPPTDAQYIGKPKAPTEAAVTASTKAAAPAQAGGGKGQAPAG